MPIIPPQSWRTRVILSSMLEMVEEPLQVIDPPLQGVVVTVVTRLVGEAAADVVRDDAAVAAAQGEDQVAVVEGPGGVAVEHDHRLAAPLVQVVEAQPVQVEVVPGKGVVFRMSGLIHSFNSLEP